MTPFLFFYVGFVGGGGPGGCWKSKQSAIPSAAASRLFNGRKPKVASQNFTKLTCECSIFEM